MFFRLQLHTFAHLCLYIRPRVQPESDIIYTRRSAPPRRRRGIECSSCFVHFSAKLRLVSFSVPFCEGRSSYTAARSAIISPVAPCPTPPQLAEGASTKHPEGPQPPPHFPSDCMCVCANFISRHSLRRGWRACALALSSAVEMLGLDVPLTMTRVLRRMQNDPAGGLGCLPPGRFFFSSPPSVSVLFVCSLKTTRLLKEKKTKAQSCSVGCCEKCKFLCRVCCCC